MKRQAAFLEEKRKLKGVLHCHTTRSDGAMAPDEALRFYASRGYDFAAITDHRIYNYENFAPETDILLIPGMEFDSSYVSEPKKWRCFHTVCLGPERNDGNGYEQNERLPSGTATTQEEYQKYLDEINSKGNLTVLAHPEWSQTPPRYIEKLRGYFAIEICNSGCAIDYNTDRDAYGWDELLGEGLRIFGVAADDAHGRNTYGTSWVLVSADKNINSVLSALERGAFYSSTGPEIYDFYVENGTAHVKCSSVSKIVLSCDGHMDNAIYAEDDSLTYGKFSIKNKTGECDYVRITVYAKDGTAAWTNPIWLDEN